MDIKKALKRKAVNRHLEPEKEEKIKKNRNPKIPVWCTIRGSNPGHPD